VTLNLDHSLMHVSMLGQRVGGGVRVKVRHLNFFAIFWSNSRPLGLENKLNLIKYPHLGITKPCNDMHKK